MFDDDVAVVVNKGFVINGTAMMGVVATVIASEA